MNIKRMRGRGHRNGGGGGIRHHTGGIPMNRNHVFDSSAPDVRLRGTAQQLFEKYLQLGRDAASTGDRVIAESYFQYAEHYFRVVNAMNQAAQQAMPAPVAPLPRRVSEVDGEEQDITPQPGMGDQPPAVERREIAIGAAPSESYANGPSE